MKETDLPEKSLRLVFQRLVNEGRRTNGQKEVANEEEGRKASSIRVFDQKDGLMMISELLRAPG